MEPDWNTKYYIEKINTEVTYYVVLYAKPFTNLRGSTVKSIESFLIEVLLKNRTTEEITLCRI